MNLLQTNVVAMPALCSPFIRQISGRDRHLTIILTIGEILVWPTFPTIANKLAPKEREGFYQGFVNSTATGGRVLGPLLGGIAVDYFGIHVLFIILLFLLCIGTLTTILYDRIFKNDAPPPARYHSGS